MSEPDFDELRQNLANRNLRAEDYARLEQLADSFRSMVDLVGDQDMTIRKLRSMMFGRTTEKTKDVLGDREASNESAEESADGSDDQASDDDDEDPDEDSDESAAEDNAKNKDKAPPKGHGRNGADKYTGAERVRCNHDSLKHGDRCPECRRGNVYEPRDGKPSTLIRLTGAPPVAATIYELQRLRCGVCGAIFIADAPDEAGDKKHNSRSIAMIALLTYGSGLPFNRLATLQRNLGVPLPASTQWDLVHKAANTIEVVLGELIRQAAQGDVVYNDDTSARILALSKEAKESLPDSRTGVFTTGIVSTSDAWKIALYFSGRQHAGENLRDVLFERAEGLAAPIQMCDALDRNVPKGIDVLLCNCMAHGRRNFVNLVDNCPDECRTVLELIGTVYLHDKEAKELGLTADERLAYHQEHSQKVIDELKAWLDRQFIERLVEPNSGLGQAITYMTKRWDKFTEFLRTPGVPLDNNICERMLKKMIMRRKNSYFFKTSNGARVADTFVSFIHTAELAGVNPLDYLTALLDNPDAIAEQPAAWMPWNYTAALGTNARSA